MLKKNMFFFLIAKTSFFAGCLFFFMVFISGCRKAKELPLPQIPKGFVFIQAGEYSFGSSQAERETALSHALSNELPGLQKRLAFELSPFKAKMNAFIVAQYPVSNADYYAFTKATGHQTPDISFQEWQKTCEKSGLGLGDQKSFYRYVLPLLWKDKKPPPGKEQFPVTLVSQEDAQEYCVWLSQKLKKKVRLPDELESSLAGGQSAYPWGEGWKQGACQANRKAQGPSAKGMLNPTHTHNKKKNKVFSQDLNSFDVYDYAGQVYEWTISPDGKSRERSILRGGGSWLDSPAECRRTCRRSVPNSTRHILLGFRVVIDPS